jgi:hypothetical protein
MASDQPARALELAEGGPDDSDIAAPIRDRAGVVRGVLAARGVPGGGSSMAALRDLAVIADWASPALCEPQPAARDEGDRGDGDVDNDNDSDDAFAASSTITSANV